MAQAAAINDAGMVLFIAENNAVLDAHGGDNAHICHIASIKDNGRFGSFEVCQIPFQLIVQGQGAGGQPGAAGAGAVAVSGEII